MAASRTVSADLLDDMIREIRLHRRQISDIQNNKTTTLPIYLPPGVNVGTQTGPPNNATDGQVFIAGDSSKQLYAYTYADGYFPVGFSTTGAVGNTSPSLHGGITDPTGYTAKAYETGGTAPNELNAVWINLVTNASWTPGSGAYTLSFPDNLMKNESTPGPLSVIGTGYCMQNVSTITLGGSPAYPCWLVTDFIGGSPTIPNIVYLDHVDHKIKQMGPTEPFTWTNGNDTLFNGFAIGTIA